MPEIATIIDELAESVKPNDLKNLVANNKEFTWAQRLGYLLEQLGHQALSEVLYQHIKNKQINIVPLVPYHSMAGSKRNTKWRVAINTIFESDIHDTN